MDTSSSKHIMATQEYKKAQALLKALSRHLSLMGSLAAQCLAGTHPPMEVESKIGIQICLVATYEKTT